MEESILGTGFRFIRFAELSLTVVALLRRRTRLASPFAANASSVKPIQPKFSSEAATPSHLCGHASAGMGRIVTLEEGKGMELNDVVAKVKELLGMKYSTSTSHDLLETSLTPTSLSVQLARPASSSTAPSKIQSVAICAGSGASLFKGLDADCYFTGEMSHVSPSFGVAFLSETYLIVARNPRVDAKGKVGYRMQSHQHGATLSPPYFARLAQKGT